MINVVSGISVVGVGFATLAMVVVLSAFNGIESLVDNLYSTFTPDVTVRPERGKTMRMDTVPVNTLEEMRGIAHVSEVIEENAVLHYDDQYRIVTMKGVDSSFPAMTGLDTMIYKGKGIRIRSGEGEERLYVGLGIRYEMNIPLHKPKPVSVELSSPIRGKELMKYRERAFNRERVLVGGAFRVNAELDSRYVIGPVEFAAKVLKYGKERSGMGIDVVQGADIRDVRHRVERALGPGFSVENLYEKNASIYRINRTEKWITFMILTFILVIATFNMIASLSMLILEKKGDIFILKSMGTSLAGIRRIFLYEGLMITLIGAASGIVTGLLLCWAQNTFGLLRMANTTIVNYYPVEVHGGDMAAILGIVLLTGFVSTWFPIRVLTRRYYPGAAN